MACDISNSFAFQPCLEEHCRDGRSDAMVCIYCWQPSFVTYLLHYTTNFVVAQGHVVIPHCIFHIGILFGRWNRESHRGFNLDKYYSNDLTGQRSGFSHFSYIAALFLFFLHTDTLVIFFLFHGKFVWHIYAPPPPPPPASTATTKLLFFNSRSPSFSLLPKFKHSSKKTLCCSDWGVLLDNTPEEYVSSTSSGSMAVLFFVVSSPSLLSYFISPVTTWFAD